MYVCVDAVMGVYSKDRYRNTETVYSWLGFTVEFC